MDRKEIGSIAHSMNLRICKRVHERQEWIQNSLSVAEVELNEVYGGGAAFI